MAAPRIYEVGEGGYIAGDDEFDDVFVIVKPVPKGGLILGSEPATC